MGLTNEHVKEWWLEPPRAGMPNTYELWAVGVDEEYEEVRVLVARRYRKSGMPVWMQRAGDRARSRTYRTLDELVEHVSRSRPTSSAAVRDHFLKEKGVKAAVETQAAVLDVIDKINAWANDRDPDDATWNKVDSTCDFLAEIAPILAMRAQDEATRKEGIL